MKLKSKTKTHACLKMAQKSYTTEILLRDLTSYWNIDVHVSTKQLLYGEE
jgi:hypothetical protein